MSYTYIVTSLLTGNVLDEVNIQSMNWSEPYNRPGSATATARIMDRTSTRDLLASWQNGFWVLEGNQIVWGGYIGAVSPISGSDTLTIPIYGFMEYANHRLIRGTQGMTAGQQTSTEITWTNIDKFLVIRDLWTHIQSFPKGNIGVKVGWDALSGDPITQTYHTYDAKMAGEAIEQLSDNVHGFDWRYTYQFVGNNPQCTIKLSNVPQGRVTDYRLEYDPQPGNKNIQSIDANADSMPVNGVMSLGAGDGAAMTTVYLADPNTDYPLFEDVLSLKDISSVQTLSDHGNEYLARNRTPISQITVTLDNRLDPNPNDLINSDQLLVVVDNGWMYYQSYYRVIQKDTNISDTGDRVTKLSLELTNAAFSITRAQLQAAMLVPTPPALAPHPPTSELPWQQADTFRGR